MKNHKTSKRILCLLLMLALAVPLLPAGAAYGQVLTPPEGYIGIYDAQGLSAMRGDPGGKYILMSDLDLTTFTAAGNGWSPVGTEDAPFTGVLDGNGHSITGLRIYRSYLNTASFVGGLFGYASGAEISGLALNIDIDAMAVRAGRYLYLGGIAGVGEDLTLTGCNVTIKARAKAETTAIGGLIGLDVSTGAGESVNTTLSGCSVTGEINTSGREFRIGGLVGRADVLDASACTNSAKLYGVCTAPDRTSAAGGILGSFNTGHFSGCRNNAVITTDVSSVYLTNRAVAYAAGIAGMSAITAYLGDAPISFDQCINYGMVTSLWEGTVYQAGIVGFSAGPITNCTNEGKVANYSRMDGGTAGIVCETNSSVTDSVNKGQVHSTAGAAAGIALANYGTITDCANWGNISSSTAAGGIAYLNSGTVRSCINAGELTCSFMGSSPHSGGVVTSNRGIVEDTLNAGFVRGAVVGGIAAENQADGVIRRSVNLGGLFTTFLDYIGGVVCYNYGTVESAYYGNGIPTGIYRNEENGTGTTTLCTLTELKNQATYAGFDFGTSETPGLWEMSPDSGFPRLTGLGEVYIKSVEFATKPKKTIYLVGEELDTTGAILKVTLSNGRYYYVNNSYTVGAYSKSSGTRSVYFSYGGKSAPLTVTFGPVITYISENGEAVLKWHYPGATMIKYYFATSSSGPYVYKYSSTHDDDTDNVGGLDIPPGKTYYVRIQPYYGSKAGSLSPARSVRSRPEMPEDLIVYLDAGGLAMQCMPDRVDGYEMYVATSLNGPYKAVASGEISYLVYKNPTKGTLYYVTVRTYKYYNGVKVYSDYSPVQWSRYL